MNPENVALPSPKFQTADVGTPPVDVLTNVADWPATIDAGPVNDGTGAGGVGATTIVRVAVLDPAAFVAVNVTTNEPALVYTLVGLVTGDGGLPSPKSHETVFAGPPVEVFVNVIVSDATGVAGNTVNDAIGAGGLTTTDRVIVLEPVSFETVKRAE